MADKSIGDLNIAPGSIDDSNTLLVCQQAGAAYKLDGHTFILALTSILDGHGGISSITYTPPVSPSLTGTMVITLADQSTTTVNVENGKGITSISKTSTSGLNDTYTISYNDGTTSNFVVKNGAKGDTGDPWYVWIRYAGRQPQSDADIGTTPDDWIGIYSGTSSTAPTHYTEYDWFQIKGEKGDTGDPATLANATVGYQQSDSGSVVPEGSWTTTVPSAVQGKYLWTRIQIQFNTGSTITAYSVARYGMDGTGAVVTVNGVSPDLNGNVQLTAADIQASDSLSIQAHLTADEADIAELKTSLNDVETNVSKILPVITGSTNNSGYTIASGDYFEANGALYKATASIPVGSAWGTSATAQSGTAINTVNSSVVDQTSGNTVSVSCIFLPGVGLYDQVRFFVPFPFLTQNTNYSISNTSLEITNVGPIAMTVYYKTTSGFAAYASLQGASGVYCVGGVTADITFA